MFLYRLHTFMFSLQCMRAPVFPWSLQHSFLLNFEDSHSSGCEVVSCGFDFSNDCGCCVSFHMLVGQLYIFFKEMSIQSLVYFLIGYLFIVAI